jgi:hypothetical protein
LFCFYFHVKRTLFCFCFHVRRTLFCFCFHVTRTLFCLCCHINIAFLLLLFTFRVGFCCLCTGKMDLILSSGKQNSSYPIKHSESFLMVTSRLDGSIPLHKQQLFLFLLNIQTVQTSFNLILYLSISALCLRRNEQFVRKNLLLISVSCVGTILNYISQNWFLLTDCTVGVQHGTLL